MLRTETAQGTTLRMLLGNGAAQDAVVPAMGGRLPPEGMAAGRVPQQVEQLGLPSRLLDRRILEAAASCLDQDIAVPLAHCLGAFRQLREAARATLADPAKEEDVGLQGPHEVTSTQGVQVQLTLGTQPLATIGFRLVISAGLVRSSAVVRQGAIEHLEIGRCTLSASLSLERVDEPLWRSAEVTIPGLRLAVSPPWLIPLSAPGVPRLPVPRSAPPAPAHRPRGG